MAETQYFPRKKIVAGSRLFHTRCDECNVEMIFDDIPKTNDWWNEHNKSFDHHLYYWQTAEVIDG